MTEPKHTTREAVWYLLDQLSEDARRRVLTWTAIEYDHEHPRTADGPLLGYAAGLVDPDAEDENGT